MYQMTDFEIKYQSSLIHGTRIGHGPELCICFHGYNQAGGHFQFLEARGGKQYTFICLDMPVHGDTRWNEDRPITPLDLLRIRDAALLAQGLSPDLPYKLIGFSMGGRIALSFYQADPSRVRKMVLVAPDGLKRNFWFWSSTQTKLGNRLFRFMMHHAGGFERFMGMTRKFRLAKPGLQRFVEVYIAEPRARELVYQRWTILRRLTIRRFSIRRLLRATQTPVHLIYGEHDRVIPVAGGTRFAERMKPLVTITVLDAGHYLLQSAYAPLILDSLVL